MSMWDLLGAPIVAAFLIVGIHTYLGLHVLRRGIIFVDLALAQIAAFGTLVAFLVGLEPGTVGAALFSLIFALLGAALFSVMKLRPGTGVPQEALIGLTYAFASAGALLLMAKAPEGAEHLRETMTGALLWVRWETVGQLALLYGVVAIIHYAGRKHILGISEAAKKRIVRSDRNIDLWDFVFYGTFAVVVTYAVATAGVLLVFTFLVAPAVLAMIWFRQFLSQLIFGWVLGAVVCVTGMCLSFQLDLPAAPTVVSVYAGVLALVGISRWLRPPVSSSIRRMTAGLAVIAFAAVALISVRHLTMGQHDESHLGHAHGGEPHHDESSPLLLSVSNADLPEQKIDACSNEQSRSALESALAAATEGFDRLALATCLFRVHNPSGAQALTSLADDDALPQMVRDQARATLTSTGTRTSTDQSG